jgi:hypothetical protein
MDLLSNRSLLPFLSSFDGGNQGLTWELKEQQWRREMSSGLFLVELNRLERRGDHWRLGQWVFIPLEAQRSVMDDTAVLTKTARIDNRKYGYFG